MKETYKNFVIEIKPDEYSENPRDWTEPLGKMLCVHNRYNLGDKLNIGINFDDFTSWIEVADYLIKEEQAEVILPLYLYDHSILRMKVGSFSGLLPQGHAEFDSGQVGFIYTTKGSILKEYSVKRISKQLKDRVEEILRDEVKEYDNYISGEVYEYVVSDPSGELVDSCWGFYGQ